IAENEGNNKGFPGNVFDIGGQDVSNILFITSKGVVGGIDGTHIPIKSPGGEDAELFRNRKGYFSINVQAVCDHEMVFTNVVSRWYGSAHDSRIFENSRLCGDLEEGKVPGILLGDAGYPRKAYLMVPLENPVTIPEKR